MTDCTITIRTDKALRDDASELFGSLGMSLSSAVNMFLRQAVMQQKFPCSLELSVSSEDSLMYPKGFFSLFGSASDLDIEDDPEELSFSLDGERETW